MVSHDTLAMRVGDCIIARNRLQRHISPRDPDLPSPM